MNKCQRTKNTTTAASRAGEQQCLESVYIELILILIYYTYDEDVVNITTVATASTILQCINLYPTHRSI